MEEKSLNATVLEPDNTRDAILLALRTPYGERTTWMIVEAEDDYEVYSKFVDKENTIVKTSLDKEGRKGYANVEHIVHDVKHEVSTAHIIGIRDADYSRYEHSEPTYVPNIFKTDQRDLEMMMLSSKSVQSELRAWAKGYDKATNLCTDVCRLFGYIRIYNHVEQLSCTFHNNVEIKKCWDVNTHSLKPNWKEECINKFLSHINCRKTERDLEIFIRKMNLENEDFHDICRGHDYLSLLSMALIHTNIYSPKKIMLRMTHSYTFDDFKNTRLYADIKRWQEEENVTVLGS